MSSTATSIVRGAAGGTSPAAVILRTERGEGWARVGQSVTQYVLPKFSLFRQAMGMWRGSLQAPSGLVHQQIDDGAQVAGRLERGDLAVRAGVARGGPGAQ